MKEQRFDCLGRKITPRKYYGKWQVGKRKGKLIVLSISEENNPKGRTCVVQCDCGTVKTMILSNLNLKTTIGCGCVRDAYNTSKSLSIEHLTVTKARTDCKRHLYEIERKRGLQLTYELSDEEVLHLATSNCHYCNCPPDKVKKSNNGRKETLSIHGIDRKNSDIGYTSENCVSACWECNNMKGKIEYNAFIEKMKLILKNLKQL